MKKVKTRSVGLSKKLEEKPGPVFWIDLLGWCISFSPLIAVTISGLCYWQSSDLLLVEQVAVSCHGILILFASYLGVMCGPSKFVDFIFVALLLGATLSLVSSIFIIDAPTYFHMVHLATIWIALVACVSRAFARMP